MEALSVSSDISTCPFSGLASLSSGRQKLSRSHIVVGDRTKSQCSDELFVTVAVAEQMVRQLDEHEVVSLHVGQGLTDEQLDALYGLKSEQYPNLEVLPLDRRLRATTAQTHKLMAHNIAISQPYENGNGTYSASLMIDDANSELSDHLTGQHISGMMIIEAARQMTIAVAETYYVAPEAKGEVSFITNKLDVAYLDFLLPISTEILFVPLTLRRAGAANLSFSCRLEFIQQGQCLAALGVESSVIDTRYFQLKEVQLINQLVKSLAD